MGFMNMFSKKKEDKTEPQNIEEYFTPVVEPVGELPVSSADHVSKFMETPIDINNNSSNEIIFDDEKPLQILTTEQKELADNGFYLSPNYINQQPDVNPATSMFVTQDSYEDSLDDELPYPDEDENVFNSNVDGSYSSVSSQPYEEERVNEHKFFSSTVDDIDSFKKQLGGNNQEKKKIIGDRNILYNCQKIDDRKAS